jgi:hypothetical protein
MAVLTVLGVLLTTAHGLASRVGKEEAAIRIITQLNTILYIRGEKFSRMRTKSRGVFAVHVIKNAHIMNDTLVNSTNFGAANLFEDNICTFGLFM